MFLSGWITFEFGLITFHSVVVTAGSLCVWSMGAASLVLDLNSQGKP